LSTVCCRLIPIPCLDVYEIEPSPFGVGGFAQLATLIKRERNKAERRGGHSLFFVCGDFLSASHLGEVLKGAHMVNLFNEMGVQFGTIFHTPCVYITFTPQILSDFTLLRPNFPSPSTLSL
jgi:hypothetical protein